MQDAINRLFFFFGLDVNEEKFISFQLQDCNCTRTLPSKRMFQSTAQQLSILGSQGKLSK